jgi:hypothetical protein
MDLNILFYVWCGFFLTTAGLALFRKFVANREDDYIHVGPGQEKYIPRQTELAKRLTAIDHWGKIVTGVTAVFGLALAAAALYQAWRASL